MTERGKSIAKIYFMKYKVKMWLKEPYGFFESTFFNTIAVLIVGVLALFISYKQTDILNNQNKINESLSNVAKQVGIIALYDAESGSVNLYNVGNKIVTTDTFLSKCLDDNNSVVTSSPFNMTSELKTDAAPTNMLLLPFYTINGLGKLDNRCVEIIFDLEVKDREGKVYKFKMNGKRTLLTEKSYQYFFTSVQE